MSIRAKSLLGIGLYVVVLGLTQLQFNGVAPLVFGLRTEFLIFAVTLLGVALLHDQTLEVALTGLTFALLTKLVFVVDFKFITHVHHEWVVLVNLLGPIFKILPFLITLPAASLISSTGFKVLSTCGLWSKIWPATDMTLTLTSGKAILKSLTPHVNINISPIR